MQSLCNCKHKEYFFVSNGKFPFTVELFIVKRMAMSGECDSSYPEILLAQAVLLIESDVSYDDDPFSSLTKSRTI